MNGRQRREVTAVLVHGGFLGPWIWQDVVTGLAGPGIPSVCVELLSSRAENGRLADLHDDARAVRAVLDNRANVVLCGHSYAGAVISEAAAGPHPAVRHLVFLAAAVPDVGDSLASLAAAGVTSASGPGEDEDEDEDISFLDDGRMVLRRESARVGLFHDCPAERAETALALLRPGNPATGSQPVTGAAWRELPSTYVRCTQDRVPELVAPGFRERAAVVTLPAGHCPQWSRPDLVAALLARIVSEVC